MSIGPGSFTGLRIGLSLVKGIAYAGNLPVAAVSTLEALAWVAEAPPGAVVWSVLDARMREVYAASFVRTTDGLVRRTPDEALPPETLARRLDASSIVVGDAPESYPVLGQTAARLLSFATHHPRGGVVARLGRTVLQSGGAADLGPLEPVYVRPSQAEAARRR